MANMNRKRTNALFAGAAPLALLCVASPAWAGAIYTTNNDGTAVNFNVYPAATDVYLNGGPQNTNASGLADGVYYFQVTDPSGNTLLSTDNAVCRKLTVAGGRVVGATGSCPHANGTFNPANGVTPVQLAPFSQSPNMGGVHKAWVVPVGKATISGSDPKVLNFSNKDAKTDNFKVTGVAPPVGSCSPSSSLSVMTDPANPTNVVSYVPKGNWIFSTPGISVVNVEGSSTLPTTNPIPTGADGINSCASNSVTGQTVCTANNANVYHISGLAATPTVTTLASAGIGAIFFSGGSCTNCGVAMDGVNNRAVIGLSLGGGAGGFQFLNLGPMTFEPPFASQTPPSGGFSPISEDPLIDPIRNLLLSATENNEYELIDVSTSLSPAFFEHPVVTPGVLDSSGEDCQTGIILAPAEFSGPSNIFIANLSSSSAVFTPGSPGTWTAPSQVQILAGSVLSAGPSGIAVAQGTHIGVASGEFGGDAITAIALPTTTDTSATTPAIQDWVTCSIGGGFSMGLDPHTLTAYQSPNAPNHAIALLVSFPATTMAKVDLTEMLNTTTVPRTGNVCTAGTLPGSVVSFIPVP